MGSLTLQRADFLIVREHGIYYQTMHLLVTLLPDSANLWDDTDVVCLQLRSQTKKQASEAVHGLAIQLVLEFKAICQLT
jgi:hypothetical protein